MLDKLTGKFGALPDVPSYGSVTSFTEVLDRMFLGRAENIEPFEASSGELHAAYTLVAQDKRCFVKIIREDNPYSHNMHYDYEWNLRQQTRLRARINKVNGELVCPDRAATFWFEGYLHYVCSYAWVPGKTLTTLIDEYLHACSISGDIGDKEQSLWILKCAFYNYGRVFSILHLDPDSPTEDRDCLLGRKVQLLLSDRNGKNELFDDKSGRIFLIDLAEEKTSEPSGTVKTELCYWFESVLDIFIILKDHFVEYEIVHLLPVLIRVMADGYSAGLPRYNTNKVQSLFTDLFTCCAKQICHEDAPWLLSAVAEVKKISSADLPSKLLTRANK